jgi:hypothetical protein
MLKQALLLITAAIIGMVVFVLAIRAFVPSFDVCLSQAFLTNNSLEETGNPYVYCSGKFFGENYGGISAFATVIVAAFTVTLWAATSRQAQLTKDALIANNRAFVFVPSFGQFWERDPNSTRYNWRLRPTLRNSGGTPTRNATMYVECEIRNTLLPVGYPFSRQAENIANVTIPPRFELSGGLVPRTAAITPQDLIEVQNGRKFIYLWGDIRYSDVFPHTPSHITRYCYQITVIGDPLSFYPNTPGQPPTQGTLAFQMLHHLEGNCMDESCR